MSYAEAVEVALCYGWIDGQSKANNETSWLQKFTPRRKRSIWSKINREKVERLISEGRVQPAGLAEVDRAKTGAGRQPMIRPVLPPCRLISKQH